MKPTRCFRTRRSARCTTSTASRVLTPATRPRTAAARAASAAFGGADGVDLGDIFGDIFGGGFGGFGGSSRQANPNAPRKGQDIRVRITLSFDEAVHGCKKNITITRQQECTECHGSGCAAGSSPETCPDCGGRGYVIRQQRTPLRCDADPAALLPLRRQGQAGQEPLQGLPRLRQNGHQEDAGGVHPHGHRRRSELCAPAAWATPAPTAALPAMSS